MVECLKCWNVMCVVYCSGMHFMVRNEMLVYFFFVSRFFFFFWYCTKCTRNKGIPYKFNKESNNWYFSTTNTKKEIIRDQICIQRNSFFPYLKFHLCDSTCGVQYILCAFWNRSHTRAHQFDIISKINRLLALHSPAK